MSVHPGPETDGISRRRLLAYLVAAPTLTVVVKWADVLDPTAPAGASPAPADIVDLTDALDPRRPADGVPARASRSPPRTGSWSACPGPRSGRASPPRSAMIVAEELDARLDDVDAVLEDARPELLFNQLTGGSNSVHALYQPMRTVAAAARARLVTAAAQAVGPAGRNARHPRHARSSRPTGAPPPSARSRRPRPQVTVPAVAPHAEGPVAVHPDRQAAPPASTPATSSPARPSTASTSTCRARSRPSSPARRPSAGPSPRSTTGRPGRCPGCSRSPASPPASRSPPTTFDQAAAARDALRITWNPGPNAALSDAQIFAQLQAATPPFAVPPLGALTIERELRLRVRPPRAARGVELRRRRPRRPGRALVLVEEPDRRQPEGRRRDRPAGRAR